MHRIKVSFRDRDHMEKILNYVRQKYPDWRLREIRYHYTEKALIFEADLKKAFQEAPTLSEKLKILALAIGLIGVEE